MKIISFGGWDFSTMSGAFNILRIAVRPGNRDKFNSNLVSFFDEHNLDGIDLDWDYHGAPGVPDIPSDDPVNGKNCYEFLSSIKNSVGSSKSVSFAAPASYLLVPQGVTYQEHGQGPGLHHLYDLQWDYNNEWTSSSCETSNCLRSHVNETATKDNMYCRGTIDIACPQTEFQQSIADGDPTSIPNATFTLMDADGFWKDIREGSWFKFSRRLMHVNNAFQYAGDDVTVGNPKEAIGDSFPKATDMLDRFIIVRAYGDWDVSMELSGYSKEEAVSNVEKRREELILNFLNGLLFLVPFVGMTTVRSLLRPISTPPATRARPSTTQSTIPRNVFMAVFSYLAGACPGRAGFRNAASSRRSLTSSEYDSL
ncbi:glycoside hydrolase superfamily [Biscogniauxia mediterranea]|nr:glycoside hydrolase superfamily [Biscogniauxia mediterranea]